MGTGARSDREAITAALDRFDAAQAEVAALSFDALTAPEVLTVKDRLETVTRRQAAVDHRLTHRLTSRKYRVALQPEQCDEYGLARNAAKEKDPNMIAFLKTFANTLTADEVDAGLGVQVEMDALDPNVLPAPRRRHRPVLGRRCPPGGAGR